MMRLKSFADNQDGTTAIEYALMAGLLSCALMAGSLVLSDPAAQMYNSMAKLTSKTNSVFAVQPAAGPEVLDQTGNRGGEGDGSWVVETVGLR